MSESLVYLNGEYLPLSKAQISVLDRGFLFGDGVYEVIPAYGGHPFRLTQHLDRLDNSLKGIRVKQPYTHKQWSEILDRLLRDKSGDDYSIYLQVTRGAAAGRDHAFPADIEPTVFVMVSPIPALKPEKVKKGISTITLEDSRWQQCDIKSITLLANVLLKQQANDQGADEAILIREGEATEGSASNLFIVKDGVITTPPKSHHLLPGITRDLVLELAADAGMANSEASIAESELQSADEIWMTSSTKEVMAVTTLNGKPVGGGVPGPVWQEMIGLYQSCKERLRTGADC